LISGWISGEDVKRSEAVNVRVNRDGSLGLRWAITALADRICPLENVGNEPRGCSAPVAWTGQACPAQLDLHPKTGLFIMRYP